MGPVLPSFLGRARELGTCALVVLSSAGCGAASGEVPRATAGTWRAFAIDASAGDQVAGEVAAGDEEVGAAGRELDSLASGSSEPLGVAAVEVLEEPTETGEVVGGFADSTLLPVRPNLGNHEDAHRRELQAQQSFARAELARLALEDVTLEGPDLGAVLSEIRVLLARVSAIQDDYQQAIGGDRARTLAALVHLGGVWETFAVTVDAFRPSWTGGITLLDDGTAPPWAPPLGSGPLRPASGVTAELLEPYTDTGECRAIANYLLATRLVRLISRPSARELALAGEALRRLDTYADPLITSCIGEERRYDPTFDPYAPGETSEVRRLLFPHSYPEASSD